MHRNIQNQIIMINKVIKIILALLIPKEKIIKRKPYQNLYQYHIQLTMIKMIVDLAVLTSFVLFANNL